uniref:Tc1-like transposase DDE domain-containing protein n=1 Tax=Amphimedon queenslandica TaxID=400682 RepID=A0A1X7VIQ7_AMPQE
MNSKTRHLQHFDATRCKIYDSYEQKEHVTTLKLLKIKEDDSTFNEGKTLLKRLLHDIGLKYRMVDNRHYYYEQPHIIKQRKSYLCKIRQNRANNKPVVFLDETWANAHNGKDFARVKQDTVTGGTLGGVSSLSGKGKRLIILGVGGDMGWIPKTILIFQSKKNTGNYNDKMTGEHFEELFRESLLPNVPPNSLIVMDNASFNSRIEEEMPKKVGPSQR